MRRLVLATLCIAVIILSSSACASSQSITVTDVWARPGVAGGNSAVYMTINNPGRADALSDVQSDVAAQVELHLTSMEPSGAMTMHHQASVAIPARGQIKFEPGGLHVMLTNLRHDLKAGDAFSLTLRFQSSGERTVQAKVREP